MPMQSVDFLWRDPGCAGDWSTGVCLHGHTLHSEECLSFLPRYLQRLPGIWQVIERYQRRRQVDFARAFWTPPLMPACAFQLERKQITDLGLRPFVSLTDHDDIEAGMLLRLTGARPESPVSVEWTVPFAGSILHLGIHNLRDGSERPWMSRMRAFTADRNEALLPELLCELASAPDVLIVLNHPFWLEEGVTQTMHEPALKQFLNRCLTWIHAFELNGTRSWKENQDVMELAERHRVPVISGGDRHACEPAACINLTSAETFEEFVSEIRDGSSTVLFMPHYREPMSHRIMRATWEILRRYPQYPGRVRWSDRIFYRGTDGIAQSLSVLWRGAAERATSDRIAVRAYPPAHS